MGVRKADRARHRLIDLGMQKLETHQGEITDAFTRLFDNLMVLVGVNKRRYGRSKPDEMDPAAWLKSMSPAKRKMWKNIKAADAEHKSEQAQPEGEQQ